MINQLKRLIVKEGNRNKKISAFYLGKKEIDALDKDFASEYLWDHSTEALRLKEIRKIYKIEQHREFYGIPILQVIGPESHFNYSTRKF